MIETEKGTFGHETTQTINRLIQKEALNLLGFTSSCKKMKRKSVTRPAQFGLAEADLDFLMGRPFLELFWSILTVKFIFSNIPRGRWLI